MKNGSNMSGTPTFYTWIDSFESHWVFEKHFLSSGNNFNPKSSQKWPESANFEKLWNKTPYIGLMHVFEFCMMI